MKKYVQQIVPGEGVRASAPLIKVVRREDRPKVDVSEHTKYARDRGTDCHLIGGYVNGATDAFIGLFSLGQNEEHPPHYHPNASEWYYIVEGSCTVLVDDQEVEARVGTAIYTPAGTIHAAWTSADQTVTLLYGFSLSDSRYAGTTWVEDVG